MKIAVHQPEHFPYLGFFQKMKEVDIFVILDDVQYTKGNFQNRNQFKNNRRSKSYKRLYKDDYFTFKEK